jgi:spermidine/putrescine transport system substrate-binding protein
MRLQRRFIVVVMTFVVFSTVTFSACRAPEPAPTPAVRGGTLVLYSWAEYMPQAVLDQFRAETGIAVTYLTYDSQDEASAAIRDRSVAFDVAVVAYDWVPGLRAARLLAELDYGNIPNFQNVSPQFRNLFYDPDNSYTVPYLWGTTGLLVRTDLVSIPVTHWANLWDDRFTGKILARPVPAELFGAALLGHGFSLNSEDPSELAAAQGYLQALKPEIEFVPVETEDALRPLLDGEAVVMIGWNGDALTARAQDPNIAYVLPEEGAITWVDNFVVSAASRHKAEAEAFINFILRPEVSAEISEAYYYPSANDAANQYVDPALRADPLVFPSSEDMARLTFYMPHSGEAEQLYESLWQEFQAAP